MAGFPRTFPATFPGTSGPEVLWTTPEGPLHEKTPLVVAIRDYQGINSAIVKVAFPTGYFELAFVSATGFGKFYEDSSFAISVPAGPEIGIAENAGPSGPGAGLTIYPVTPEAFGTGFPYDVIISDGVNTETATVTGKTETGRLELDSALVNDYLAGSATVRLAGTGVNGYYELALTLVRRPHWPTDMAVTVEAEDINGNWTIL